MSGPQPNVYAGGDLDRADAHRTDDAWVASRLRDPASRVVLVTDGRVLVAGEEHPRAVTVDAAALASLGLTPDAAILLGVRPGGGDADGSEGGGGVAYFAADLGGLAGPAGPGGDPRPPVEGARFEDLRAVGPLLPPADASLLAYARGMAHWRRQHRYCGACGAPTRPAAAGHVLRCTGEGCGVSHHPRTDPAVIMLVHDGGARALLARNRRHPPGMHSVLAGFVEPGESLEEAVAREVREEVGLPVEDVRYRSSQPWPFPGSLMIGFHARATSDDIRIDGGEIRTARWFTRDELHHSPEDETFRLPRRDSIARRLVEEWLAAG